MLVWAGARSIVKKVRLAMAGAALVEYEIDAIKSEVIAENSKNLAYTGQNQAFLTWTAVRRFGPLPEKA
jgi:hypothetical protein